MTLTRDQADILLACGWLAVDALLDPGTGISHAKSTQAGSGGSNPLTWYCQTTAAGIEGRRGHGADRVDVLVSWSLVTAASRALPEQQRADLAWARRRLQQERRRDLPPYLAGGQAPWVRCPPQWKRDAQRAQDLAMVAALDSLVPADELLLF